MSLPVTKWGKKGCFFAELSFFSSNAEEQQKVNSQNCFKLA